MISTVLMPLRVSAIVLVGVIVSFGMGLLNALTLGVQAGLDGRITIREQQTVEEATWNLGWVTLRKLPFLRID